MAPLVVVVRVTTECSLRCQFCGYSKDVQRPRSSIDTNRLRALGKYLSELQHTTRRPVLVSWLGGEPFQWPQWLEMSTEFAEQCGLNVGITTNGLALHNDSVRQTALKLFRQITVSVDGLAEHHDQLRKQSGMFQRLKETCALIQAERDPRRTLLRVNTVLTRTNIDSFGEFCWQLCEWHIDEVTFNPLGGNDRPEFVPANRLTVAQNEIFAAELEALKRDCGGRGLHIRGTAAYLQRMHATASVMPIAIDDCRPGTDFLFVDEFGRLSPCSYTAGRFSATLESLDAHRPTSLPQILADERKSGNLSACQDCHANHVFQKVG